MAELKEFKLPDVGEGMEEAEVVRWLVKAGDPVRIDQVMLEIQTDKALVEIPSPVAGTVAEIKVREGQIAHVGTVLVSFNTATDQTAPVPVTAVAPSSSVAVRVSPVAAAANVLVANGHSAVTSLQRVRVRAAPAVRKRALELDIDLSQVQPSSPDGRVLLQDVLNYVKPPNCPTALTPTNDRTRDTSTSEETGKLIMDVPTDGGHTQTVSSLTSAAGSTNGNGNDTLVAPNRPEAVAVTARPKVFVPTFEGGTAQEERKALVGLRRRIAERMEQSWRTIPHVATFDDADGHELVALRQRLLPAAATRGIKLTYLPLIVKAVVQALKQHPIFNSSLDDQTREIIYKCDYHIGLATATPDGLLVPVVRYADRLTLLQLAAEINRLSEGARNRTLKGPELSGSTFTITNFGSFGGQRGTPIINPPEAAILGVGQIKEQAVARDGQVVVRPILPLSLSYDHRLIDGADGGAFSRTLIELLENPDLLMLDMV